MSSVIKLSAAHSPSVAALKDHENNDESKHEREFHRRPFPFHLKSAIKNRFQAGDTHMDSLADQTALARDAETIRNLFLYPFAFPMNTSYFPRLKASINISFMVSIKTRRSSAP